MANLNKTILVISVTVLMKKKILSYRCVISEFELHTKCVVDMASNQTVLYHPQDT